MRRLLVVFAAAALALAMAVPAVATTIVLTPNGTWTAYPGQSTTYQAAVQQPINTDGSSNFKANGKTVIPVKFALSQGTGAFVFQSIYSDGASSYTGTGPCGTGTTAEKLNDCSYLNFAPATLPTLADISELSAIYAFTSVATCQGGSLRWTLYLNDNGVTRNLDVHFQPGTGGIGLQICAPATSGKNMADMSSSDPYVVIQDFLYTGTPYTFSSSYNVTYAEAVSQLGGLQVLGMNLALDSGWGVNGNQVVNLTSATVGVGGTTPYTDTFTPQPASALAPVCPTQPATIKITKVDGASSGDVNEPLTIQPQDNNSIFRIVDCMYMYNLATSSLSGVGTYTVYATIGSTTFVVGTFDLK